MRKLFAAAVAVMFAVGGLFAEEIKGAIFKKFADGKVTVEVDGKEKTIKLKEGLKVKQKGKDGTEKEVEVAKMLEKAKEGSKWTVTVEKDEITELKREKTK